MCKSSGEGGDGVNAGGGTVDVEPERVGHAEGSEDFTGNEILETGVLRSGGGDDLLQYMSEERVVCASGKVSSGSTDGSRSENSGIQIADTINEIVLNEVGEGADGSGSRNGSSVEVDICDGGGVHQEHLVSDGRALSGVGESDTRRHESGGDLDIKGGRKVDLGAQFESCVRDDDFGQTTHTDATVAVDRGGLGRACFAANFRQRGDESFVSSPSLGDGTNNGGVSGSNFANHQLECTTELLRSCRCCCGLSRHTTDDDEKSSGDDDDTERKEKR